MTFSLSVYYGFRYHYRIQDYHKTVDLLKSQLVNMFSISGICLMLFLNLFQFNDLQECYLQKRRQLANPPHVSEDRDKNFMYKEGYNAGLAHFQSVLTTFTRYRYRS